MLNKVSPSCTCPSGVELREDFLHPHLLNSLVYDPSHLFFKAVQVQLQQVSQSGFLLTEKYISILCTLHISYFILFDKVSNILQVSTCCDSCIQFTKDTFINSKQA